MISPSTHTAASHQRIMLKLSGEALKWTQKQSPFDISFLDRLCEDIKSLREQGKQIALVVGGGNLYRWAQGLDGQRFARFHGDNIGMLATVMNGIALHDRLVAAGIPSHVMCAFDIPRMTDIFMTDRAVQYLNQGDVVLCVGGTGNPFFTTDTGAVQRALELECDLMVKATKVDGVYDDDPMTNPDATKYDRISLHQALTDHLHVMDQTALALAHDNDLPIYVCHMNRLRDIDDLAHGTYVSPDE